MSEAERLIAQLGLHPLPGEGGYFRRTWTGAETPTGPAGTAIYFLLTRESFSAFHRVHADELWHFYSGDPVEHWQLTSCSAEPTRTVLGADILHGQATQLIVPARTWQAARLDPVTGARGWALLGCTMCPGWDPTRFELESSAALARHYPAASRIIAELTRA